MLHECGPKFPMWVFFEYLSEMYDIHELTDEDKTCLFYSFCLVGLTLNDVVKNKYLCKMYII